jgi:hypothetical protein
MADVNEKCWVRVALNLGVLSWCSNHPANWRTPLQTRTAAWKLNAAANELAFDWKGRG